MASVHLPPVGVGFKSGSVPDSDPDTTGSAASGRSKTESNTDVEYLWRVVKYPHVKLNDIDSFLLIEEMNQNVK